ncbi:hypothetical protein [Streptomyces sp. NPDC001568]|uniref:hypothetical protein n=1 Tax=Streptomyces sp. NPDC001568 TaxID=3364588 RepID=UPI00367AD3D8
MSRSKVPDYVTGRHGPHWTHSLRAAQRAGAVIIADDSGEPVRYARADGGPGRFRPWVDAHGTRYDSHDVHPEW